MKMLCKGGMTNIFSQPLMMLHGPLASSVFWISLLQFFEDAWSKSLVNDVIRILANDLWSINRHTLPLFVHGCMNATEKAAGGGCWRSWRRRMRIGSTTNNRGYRSRTAHHVWADASLCSCDRSVPAASSVLTASGNTTELPRPPGACPARYALRSCPSPLARRGCAP
jgi:hypothetical protein